MRRPQASIFDRQRLKPSQFRTVAARRLDDAKALHATGRNARANGAMYLAGFVIECLLKARLLEKHPWLQAHYDAAKLTGAQRSLHMLAYSHDLDGLLQVLPELEQRLTRFGQRHWVGPQLLRELKTLVRTWTIHVRYSTLNATIDEAGRFISQVEEAKRWLS